MTMLRFCVIVGFLMIFEVASAFATLWEVPITHPTIQAAITAAANTDTVLVDPGVYYERIDFLGKDILVTSEYLFSGDTTAIINTVLDGDSCGSVVKMVAGETNAAQFIGFTVKHGIGSLYQPGYGDFHVGGGFYLIGSSPTIDHNIITENFTIDGGAGIFSDGGNPIINLNTIISNQTSPVGCGAGLLIKNATGGEIDSNSIQFNAAGHGGGVALKHANISVTRNVISNNTASSDGGGIRIYTESAPSIINNTISDNSAPDALGGGVEVLETSAPIFMNNIVSFTAGGGGFVVVGACTPDLSYNLFWQNTGGNYVNVAPGIGDLTGDPAYVGGAPFDYHLTGASMAIDHGNPNPIYNDPDATRNDCGAFYYDQGPTTPVVLASFSASPDAEGVALHWTTASEINCYGWLVERCQDHAAYQAISPLIRGYGTTEEPRAYNFVDVSAQAGQTYTYRLKQIDIGGAVTYFSPITITAGVTLPGEISLKQNYPNPFNPETSIIYDLPAASAVSLTVFNAAGKLVAQLASGYQPAGQHSLTWNAEALPSGSYLCRLQAAGQIFTRSLVLLK